MALKEPTPISFLKAVSLCWKAMVSPAAFDAIEKDDMKLLERQPDSIEHYRIDAVRKGLGEALIWCLSAAAIGCAAGWLAAKAVGASGVAVASLGVVGTAVLLWATLAIKGWDIATFSNNTLTERVNRWIFRGLYWIGTTLVVVAASWNVWT